MHLLKEQSESIGKKLEYYHFQGNSVAVQAKEKGYGEDEIYGYMIIVP